MKRKQGKKGKSMLGTIHPVDAHTSVEFFNQQTPRPVLAITDHFGYSDTWNIEIIYLNAITFDPNFLKFKSFTTTEC